MDASTYKHLAAVRGDFRAISTSLSDLVEISGHRLDGDRVNSDGYQALTAEVLDEAQDGSAGDRLVGRRLNVGPSRPTRRRDAGITLEELE